VAWRALLLTGAICAGASGCGPSGAYVWAQDVPAQAPPGDYLIRDGDVLLFRVVNQDAMQTRARVRTDGKVALPLLGDVDVRGKRPSALRAELEARLKEFIVAPSVTVNVEELGPIPISVMGEVARAGNFALEPGSTISQALAAAGGLTDFASHDRIFLLRKQPPMRVRFSYDSISQGDTPARFTLHDGDVIVVE
jgi:polysaccharide export outer membrane protein